MNKYKTEIKWAGIFIAVSLIWMLAENLTGLHSEHIDKHMWYTNLFAIPAIAIYVFALLDKRNSDYNGTMTYKQGFMSGLIITLIVAIFSPLTQYITNSVISPDYFSNAISFSVSSGAMTQEQAESYFTLQNYIIQGFIGAIVMGVLTSAIVAFFTKKDALGGDTANKSTATPAV